VKRPAPREITVRRLTFLISLPDRALCIEDHRTGPAHGTWPCGRNDAGLLGDVISCSAPGTWARTPRLQAGRRGCTRHVAAEIRAEHWHYRDAILKGLVDI
jgi:hypothetical protein